MKDGLSLFTVLFVVFLVLKLVGTITWSWWWVTAPLWIPILIQLGIIACVFGVGALVFIGAYIAEARK